MSIKLPTLYSRTSTGAVQEWTVEIEGDSYRTHHGQTDGKIVTTEWYTAKATNVGRANERSADVQALFEAKATWKKKKDGGYFENIDDIDTALFVEPMLAKNWEDRKSKVVFPVFSQPKLDGCLHGDSLVDTEHGKIKIRELFLLFSNYIIEDLPKLKTFNEETGENEFKSIKNVIINGIDIKDKNPIWYKITTDNGNELILTGNHRIWVDNLRCWRRVDELDGTETLKNSI